ncbi:hypothetical protein FCM35_KLT09945 [Carex littledalei]|uniref:Uncharacterized protein n=1 Tax=Carex littledalei TaxID=544730 RepID=A0A833RL46_9POAL|nr:hypothetical protein FCM35_KLT09945 [Carex littledalei]
MSGKSAGLGVWSCGAEREREEREELLLVRRRERRGAGEGWQVCHDGLRNNVFSFAQLGSLLMCLLRF